jgi:hypothetical protein
MPITDRRASGASSIARPKALDKNRTFELHVDQAALEAINTMLAMALAPRRAGGGQPGLTLTSHFSD